MEEEGEKDRGLAACPRKTFIWSRPRKTSFWKMGSTSENALLEDGVNLLSSLSSVLKRKTDPDVIIYDQRELMVYDRAVMTFQIVNMLCPEGFQSKFA